MHRLSPRLPFALLAGLALAAPVSRARATSADRPVTISGYTFAPGAVTVDVGDTVTWRFAGPDTNHSITTEPDQPETFDSDPGREPTSFDHLAGSTYRHTFTAAGVTHYFCKVHPGMRAAVTVVDPKAAPLDDTVKPVLGAVRVTRRGARTSLRLTVSERARVTVGLRRGATRLEVVRSVPKGTSSLRLPSGLGAGSYAVTVRARDAAGNVSATRRVAVRIGPRR